RRVRSLTSGKEYDFCVYDSNIATGYDVGTLLLLAVGQVVLMVASRCFCCGRGLKPGGSRACALILFLFTCCSTCNWTPWKGI
ncbi:hypothetical protein SORBI_3001G269650, partial [Sorghum bicolor]